METVYRYAWKNNVKRAALYGRLCRVLARGRMNSIMIEFLDNGQREITSRNAVRPRDVTAPGGPQLEMFQALDTRRGGGK
jgi:hypothetical protein